MPLYIISRTRCTVFGNSIALTFRSNYMQWLELVHLTLLKNQYSSGLWSNFLEILKFFLLREFPYFGTLRYSLQAKFLTNLDLGLCFKLSRPIIRPIIRTASRSRRRIFGKLCALKFAFWLHLKVDFLTHFTRWQWLNGRWTANRVVSRDLYVHYYQLRCFWPNSWVICTCQTRLRDLSLSHLLSKWRIPLDPWVRR